MNNSASPSPTKRDNSASQSPTKRAKYGIPKSPTSTPMSSSTTSKFFLYYVMYQPANVFLLLMSTIANAHLCLTDHKPIVKHRYDQSKQQPCHPPSFPGKTNKTT